MLPIIDPSRPITEKDIMSGPFRYFIQVLTELVNMITKNSAEDTIELEDDEEILLLEASAGFGTCLIGDNQEFTQFQFTTAGVVTLLNNTTNVANTDSDGNLCIYDNGTNVNIKNRLGSTLYLRYSIKYNQV